MNALKRSQRPALQTWTRGAIKTPNVARVGRHGLFYNARFPEGLKRTISKCEKCTGPVTLEEWGTHVCQACDHVSYATNI